MNFLSTNFSKSMDLKKISFFALLFFFIQLNGYCQPGDPGEPGVPIDGGISLLAAAGIGYGAKKIIDHRKKKNTEEEE